MVDISIKFFFKEREDSNETNYIPLQGALGAFLANLYARELAHLLQ